MRTLSLHPLYSFICYFLTILLAPALAHSSPTLSAEQAILLRSSSSGACATAAAISSSRLITNAHVARLVCPYNDCGGLKAYRAPNFGAPASLEVPTGKIKLEFISNALDIAFLRSEQPQELATVQFATPRASEEVYVLGFPRCGVLTQSSGSIQKLTNIHIHTDAQSAHGSSGSLAFDTQGQAIGLLDQSDSLLGAINSLLTGKTFPARAVRGDIVEKLLARVKEMEAPGTRSVVEGKAASAVSSPNLAWDWLITEEAQLLLEFYRTEVFNKAEKERTWPAMSFMSLIDGLRSDLLAFGSAYDAQIFLATGDYPSTLTQVPLAKTPQAELLERLLLAHNIEYKGAFEQLLTPLHFGRWEEALRRSARSAEQISALAELMKPAVEAHRQGLVRTLTRWGALIVLSVMLALSLWCLSLGFIWNWFNGSFIRKVIASTLFAVTWPVSLLVFALPRAARNKLRGSKAA